MWPFSLEKSVWQTVHQSLSWPNYDVLRSFVTCGRWTDVLIWVLSLLLYLHCVTETLETLIRQAENYTSILFCNTYRNMALEAAASIQEFFTDVGLYLFGADVNPEEFVNRFFDNLFPLVYNHLINPGVTDSSPQYSECIRMARQNVSPFGNIPKRVMGQMGRSLLPSRTFLQALNLGIEVINTTDHMHFSKECSRALLRMQYCPHCQSLMLSKPCMGYCLNVVRGCLAHMTELNPHWHAYIRSLEELSDAMHGTYDVEHVLLNFHLFVNDAVLQAHLNGQKLLDQVRCLCASQLIPLNAKTRQVAPQILWHFIFIFFTFLSA